MGAQLRRYRMECKQVQIIEAAETTGFSLPIARALLKKFDELSHDDRIFVEGRRIAQIESAKGCPSEVTEIALCVINTLQDQISYTAQIGFWAKPGDIYKFSITAHEFLDALSDVGT
jgi:hypothetical protein